MAFTRPLNLETTEALHTMRENIEKRGADMKKALDAGDEFYRPHLERMRADWRAIKKELDGRAIGSGLAPAAHEAPSLPKVSPTEFHRMCAGHDWSYQYSDDPGAYRSGKASESHLEALAANQPELKPIYAAWKAHAAGGDKPGAPQE